MARLKSYILGAGTLCCALGIGYVMQYGLNSPFSSAKASDEPLALSDIVSTSSGLAAPRLPADTAMGMGLPAGTVELAAADPIVIEGMEDMPQDPVASGFDCAVDMQATPVAGAMVDLSISAPCNASERLTLHHNGMMFTEITQPDGSLTVTVPALSERAIFIAAFASGEGGSVTADVSSLPFYDRVVVQWKGEAGLQLHAREFGADYFQDGHVWAAAAGDLADAARGEGGFLVRLGREDTPEALMAEVYSFPAGTAQQAGDVILSVEAEVTASNCAAQIEAQTLELRGEDGMRVRDLTLEIPECDSVGDFLVLKNLIEDLKIASR
ncbi:MAG: translocase [Paracoccaceae bacterium]|nr:translocase [Paracoccaceae bacterium]